MTRLFFTTALFLCACVTGPKTENKTPLSVLNGKNYSTLPEGAVVPNTLLAPIIVRRERETVVAGKVMLVRRPSALPSPVSNQKILLTQNRITVAETRSAADGIFNLVGVFPNGTYMLELNLRGKKFARAVEIRDYELKDIIFLVEL